MKIVSIGGGPAGLYFGILMKNADPAHEVTIIERNRADDTFGFGVVFSDRTMDNLAEADRPSYDAITDAFAHWDDIHIHYKGKLLTSTGHGFAGLSRMTLLQILTRRCEELGVDLRFETEVDDLTPHLDADLVLGADGVNSFVRGQLADDIAPNVDMRPNRFVWLGTTFPFEAFTFYFKENEHGLWRVHAYRYAEDQSTFIVECTAETLERSGLGDGADEDQTVAYMEALFADELKGHKLLKNRSLWRQFPNIENGRWSHDNVVLVGDAVHTAHFSIGSGTKLAMEDVIALRDAVLANPDMPTALAAYEAERRPQTESLRRAAQVSLQWFEETERYMGLDPTQFGFSLLTRSLRVTHENLRLRDPEFVAGIDEWFATGAEAQSGASIPRPEGRAPPPAFTPFKLRDMTLDNRVVVSPMCQYSATDGEVGDWHLVHLGSRAIGGAGLIMAEMTAISADARITPGCAGLYAPEHQAAWRRITDFVHSSSTAKIGVQLGHAGRKGSTQLMWDGDNEPLKDGAWPLVSASALPWFEHSQTPRAIDRAEMNRVKQAYVRATQMASDAGFDIIELHCAHGYLLASFLSPLTNQRDDGYGGDLEARARYPLEVFDAMRAVWPSDKPMSVRISATDWAPGGFSPDDAVALARLFKAHDCDIIDVSAGQTVPEQKPVYGRLFQTPFSDRIRLEAEIPTMTVGNVSSYEDVNSILAAGRADLCLLARAHLFDPYWTRHAAHEMGHSVQWPPQYGAVALPRYNPRFK